MNLRKFSPLRAALALSMGLTGTASAVTTTIGTQHFTNGQTVGTGTFLGAVSGQPAPFDQFYGGDVAGPDFDVNWTFNYVAPAAVFSATLTIGLFDGDFTASGQQLSQLTIDGNPITLAGASFEAGPGGSGQYGVYSIALPPTVFTSLADGSAAVHFALQGPGLGVIGETTNNGAGIDFATLDIQEVPEPGASVLACLAGLAASLRRRRERRA
jgi:hypothetical protein